MKIELEPIGSAGQKVTLSLDEAAFADADFSVDIPSWSSGEPQWVIAERRQVSKGTASWSGVVTMNADGENPGRDPGRPDEGEVEAAFKLALDRAGLS